jgi:hypothetical protein
MDNESPLVENAIDDQYIINQSKFITLSIVTFGLYELWWFYKAWRFYEQKDKLRIMPAFRALFSILFLPSLLSKINKHARSLGYEKNLSPGLIYIGYLIFSLLAFLPLPFSFVALLGVLFLLPPFKALCFAKQNSTGFLVVEQKKYSARQFVLLVLGVLLWFLIIANLFVEQAG